MLITSEKDFYESLSSFTDVMVVDVETTGFDVWNVDKICGVGVCTSDFKTFYYPFRHKSDHFPLQALLFDDYQLNLPMKLIHKIWDKLNGSKKLIGHNIKFDLAAMSADGFVLDYKVELVDTVSAARLYFKKRFDKLTLSNCSNKLVPGAKKDNWKDAFKEHLKLNKLTSYDQAHPKDIAEYCETDCLNTFKVFIALEKHIETTGQTIVWQQEQELTKTLWYMELEGLHFDNEYCERKIPLLEAKIETLRLTICARVGYEFDILSNSQLTKALNSIGIECSQIDEVTGKSGWGSAELLGLEDEIGSKILEYRGIEKMRGTYFAPLSKWKDGRQHPSFKAAGTITGRMSCEQPNLQNLSNKSILLTGDKYDEEALEAIKALLGARGSRTVVMQNKGGGTTGGGTFSNLISSTSKFEDSDDSVSVKKLYVPPEGYFLYLIDYNQMEMRVFSDYVRDEAMDAILEDYAFDFHAYVAKEVWKVDESAALWKFYRTLAKAINFGLIYGIGTDKLAQQIQKTYAEAKTYREEYFARFPKAKKFMARVGKIVETRGWIKNRFGRRYYIEAERAYTGVNYLVQGTSADIVKNRMTACRKYLMENNFKSVFIVQVHDELVFYIHESEEREVVPKLKEIIEHRLIQTLLPAEVSKGFPSWAEKADVCLICFDKKEERHACQQQ